jgi:arginyl-tRNA synthetase
VVFDWDEILNMQGNSGPYVQYTFARTQSVLRKANASLLSAPVPRGGSQAESLAGRERDVIIEEGQAMRVQTGYHSNTDPSTRPEYQTHSGSSLSYQLNEEESAVLRWLYRFPEMVERAAVSHQPQIVANYLFELAQRFNAFYNKHSILGAAQDEKSGVRSQESESGAELGARSEELGKTTQEISQNANNINISGSDIESGIQKQVGAEVKLTPDSEILTTTQFRLSLTAGVGQVLKNGLSLLGIAAPEKM